MNQRVALGKPADSGEKILSRRFRLTTKLSRIVRDGGRLLDLGCGNGALTEFFRPHFDVVVGADIQPELLSQAASDINRVATPAEKLPFNDNSFDAVISYEVMEHVQEPIAMASEMYRVLKPGGQLVITVPNKWWVFETHGAYLPLLPWNRVPFFSWLPESIHSRWAKARIYTKDKIARTLISGGFSEMRMYYLTAPMDRARPQFLQRFLQRFVFGTDSTNLPFAAVSILVVADKR